MHNIVPRKAYRIVNITVAIPVEQANDSEFYDWVNEVFRPQLDPVLVGGKREDPPLFSDYRIDAWDTAPVHLAHDEIEEGGIFSPGNSVKSIVDGFSITHGDDSVLDEIVHEAKAEEASQINNGGPDSQIRFLQKSGVSDLRILAIIHPELKL